MRNIKLAVVGIFILGAASACTEEKTTERTETTRVVEKEVPADNTTTEVEVEKEEEPNVKVDINKDGDAKVGVKSDKVDVNVER